jgi:hypothetical protein
LRQYEAFRPEIEDLLPVTETISRTQAWGGEWWLDMESRTEASYCAQALAGDWPDAEYRTKKPMEKGMGCVCTSDLDLHSGTAFLHGKLHGNLRTDDAREVFKRAFAHGSVPWESLFFSTDARPTVQELARTHGDQIGHRVYRDRDQMRLRWLDLALEEHRMF